MKPLSSIVSFLVLVVLSSLSLTCNADSKMQEFYKNANNKSVFEKAQSGGQIKKGRDAMIAACAKAKAQNPKANCECVKKVINKTSDEEFFYESMLSIRLYKETMKALRAKDQNKINALKAEQAQRKGFPQILSTKCGLG